MYSSAFVALAFSTLVSSVQPRAHTHWLDTTSWRPATVHAMRTITLHRPCAAPVYTVTETVCRNSSRIVEPTHITLSAHVTPYINGVTHMTLPSSSQKYSTSMRPSEFLKPSKCGQQSPCKNVTSTMRTKSVPSSQQTMAAATTTTTRTKVASSSPQTVTATTTRHHVSSITSTEIPNPDLIPPLPTPTEASSKSSVRRKPIHMKSTYIASSGQSNNIHTALWSAHEKPTHSVSPGHKNATHMSSSSSAPKKPTPTPERSSKTQASGKSSSSTDTMEVLHTSYIPTTITSQKTAAGSHLNTMTVPISSATSDRKTQPNVPLSTTTITWETNSASKTAHTTSSSSASSVREGTPIRLSPAPKLKVSSTALIVSTTQEPSGGTIPTTANATTAEPTNTATPETTSTLASGSQESSSEPDRDEVRRHCNDTCNHEHFCVRLCMKHNFYKLPSGGLIVDMWPRNKTE